MPFFAAPFVLLEILIFAFLAVQFGFFKVFGFYLLPTVLGVFLLMSQSRAGLMRMQQMLAQGQDPGRQVLETASRFIAGLLLLAPTVGTRVMALLLLLPGTRKVMIILVQAWLMKKIASGGIHVFSAGAGPGFRGGFSGTFRGGFPGGFPGGPPFDRPIERDAQVIDIEAKRISDRPPSTSHEE